jgi:RNA recognition motif-containing protein
MPNSIYIGNLSYNATEIELRKLFGRHGEYVTERIVRDFNISKSKRFGFIEIPEKHELKNVD